ncbi:HAD family hydrolase [Ruminiclostridium papyrosolvens]|uniref:Haloacid dehalogenase n=1 Tax=Ruminiclostridium papyrosolvens C7 TaxID=1330534 RepID=U4R007_9FIRM|nr:HAD-IA family hydrolase [Ruminiclostridium papyrosolvens]EPR10569.1 haloacid dehalogenase [Ruminiclostridium papyrosolvens C7]
MRKAAIFDFDGVIINSLDIQKQALEESYKIVVGKGTPSFREFLSHSGNSLENIFKNMNLPLEMVKHYRRISQEKVGTIKIYPGIREILTKLKDDKVICALCTGKDRVRTLEILEKFCMEKFFSIVVCSDDVKHPKPHPDSLIHILNQLDIDANSALMIGDAKNDIKCAKNAGVKSIAVTWGGFSQADLEQESPNLIVNNMFELYTGINMFLDIKQIDFVN